ncbi:MULTISPECIES: class I SAM-dependent methyltransferase [unclassified Paenibacillus]|uniref:tRNA (adenine(22)-N(1))-methyltransferase n=1 Tax=unclassified Paenibacillus TaxID=185978 RepID=UPI000433AA64|nr:MULTISPECIES: class I SAM-dependent methyltransferase [unclassified Paenibacillus]KKC47037.1 SAM-dependent methyltransferase [Paenibacillus sp. D9]CDN41617.1 tRNA (adenine(22)-N(1))-methyltransferase [Paenibacillus sp. P22]
MLISKRLSAIAGFVSKGSRIADIGSDHALLPVYLVQSGISPSGIAGELNEGPLEAARRGIAAAGLTSLIQARRGNGLEVLQTGEADAVTIAGMGGGLIRTILDEGAAAGKLEGVTELVLQPNIGEELVRQWLREQGWYLQDETILEEDGKFYEVLHAVRNPEHATLNDRLYGSGTTLEGLSIQEESDLRLKMGPWLLRGRNETEAFALKWRSELKKLERIVGELQKSGTEEAAARAEGFRRECRLIEEVLSCSQADNSSQD